MAKKKTNDGQLTPEEIIKSYIERHDEEGINETPKGINPDILVSTGSLKFDKKTGGLAPSILRFVGPTECGKTSEAFEIAKNFLNTVPNSKVVYYKAEGRLSKQLLERTGIDQSRLDIVSGRECGFIFGMMKALIRDTRGIHYMFIVDSTDALTVKANNSKGDEEQKRVGGGNVPMVLGNLLPQLSEVMRQLGHYCIFLSQHRDNIVIGYQAKTKNVDASGGNALLHYPDWTFEFGFVRSMDLIREKLDSDDEPSDDKDKILGHNVRVTIKKSPNETTHEVVKYPVRRRAPAGKSIWREREVYEFLVMYDFIKKKGAWLSFSEDAVEKINQNNLEIQSKIKSILKKSKIDGANDVFDKFFEDTLTNDDHDIFNQVIEELPELVSLIDVYIGKIPEQVQGEANLMDILDTNPALVELFIKMFKDVGIL